MSFCVTSRSFCWNASRARTRWCKKPPCGVQQQLFSGAPIGVADRERAAIACSVGSVAMDHRVVEAKPELFFASNTTSSISHPTSLPSKNQSLSGLQDIFTDMKPGQFNDKVVVVGHRGCGKNKTLSQGEIPEARPSIRENTICSFNTASKHGANFVEFDVQVTKDGHPIIFHDDYIISGDMVSKKIGEITLDEFLAIGPQKDAPKNGSVLGPSIVLEGKPIYRKSKVDEYVGAWTATVEDSMCTLQEAFERVESSVGFNIEVKFDDVLETSNEEMRRVIFPILDVVERYANGRKIYYSSFHPDAVHILGSAQSVYPVFFLTDGGVHLYNDQRRNSIQAAIEVCQQSSLQGIVTEVRAILHEPSLVSLVKQAGIWLFTYGELNNLPEVAQKQKVLGVDGVIVDHVLEIVTVVHDLEKQLKHDNLQGQHQTQHPEQLQHQTPHPEQLQHQAPHPEQLQHQEQHIHQ